MKQLICRVINSPSTQNSKIPRQKNAGLSMAEGISVWGSVPKAQGQELQEFVVSLVL